mmetsp:Transcript_45140/g.98126  ORF Transcript_45140/g.98126 Transcript_45140/m.98126 type:complete len:251 (+) Transcript_45140:53-805(+)
MADWVGDTGCKRSAHDTEAERRPVKPDLRPQKASADSTGFTSQVAGLMTESIMEAAMADKAAAEAKKGLGYLAQEQEDSQGKGADDCMADEDKAGGSDDEIEMLRARRRQQMKDAQAKKKKFAELGHGNFDEIIEEEFLKTVTSSERCIVHFYHRNFERCKIMDMHLGRMPRVYFGTRFVKLDAEKSPFFVERLQIRTLPCVIVFVDGVAKGRQVGFDGLRSDEFSTTELALRLKDWGGIEEEIEAEEES